jgi:flotillin
MLSLPLFQMVPLLPFELNSTGFLVGSIVVLAAMILFGVLPLLARRYKRCPSNRVLVIYGKAGQGQAVKCLHGGATFVWPLIQDYAYLSLEPIQIEIPLRGALSAETFASTSRACSPWRSARRRRS